MVYHKAACLLLAGPVAILASPFAQQTTPLTSTSATTSPSSTQPLPETITTEVISATISGQWTTFTHTNEARMSVAIDGRRNLYLADPLFKKVVDLVYNKQVCSNAPDRPTSTVTSSLATMFASNTSAISTSISTTSQAQPTSPTTLSTSPTPMSSSITTTTASSKSAAPAPSGSGSPQGESCSVNGELVCDVNDSSVFGVCNWSKYVWRDVAAGTACQNGTIVGVGIYSTPSHKRSQPLHEIPAEKSEGHPKRDDSTPYVLDRPVPGVCFDDDMKAIMDGMKPGGSFTADFISPTWFIGLSQVVPGYEVQVIPHGNTNFTQYVEVWESYAFYDPDLLWVDRDQLKESVDRVAYFLLYPENWYEQFQAEAQLHF
ncbi:hypothetical protein M409DRAFT_60827 [Zasmidium cellare ATCC 36951]|uniref:Glycosyltransferase family 90 protein n=1 Tax=Zasmidium cellare ATCC 36951 TaxID=1080233 RepID=A0A6A6BY07_ZASCE|nr:uncharacterized protein M409DRAFT_60827 [Zasmidium cellare ATCC 36951]KAF2159483.1 hypothetical protein M409DRAFT_60827 [Zasmidium cellare ATCC 36951]